jgi:hypothetical protein
MIILNAGNEVGRFACENLAIMLWCCGGGVWFCIPVLRPVQPWTLLWVTHGPERNVSYDAYLLICIKAILDGVTHLRAF